MPFTFSHPAIILPLSKSKNIRLSFTGLIAGSMAPDFEFLLRLRNTENFGHTWPGVLACDIPFAIALSFVFHYFVRDTLILHLPKYFRQRFVELIKFNWWLYLKQHKFNFFAAVLIGILSHFFLDSFTHQNKIIEQWVPFFSAVIVVFKQPLPVPVILQIITSLIGGLYILWFITKMEKGEDVLQAKSIAGYWTMMGVLTTAIFALRLLFDKVHQSTADIIIAGVGSFVYAFLLVTIIYFKRTIGIKKKSPEN